MKFEQNNHSVYSCSFYCSLPSVILCAPNREGRETYTQDVLSCLQHTLGLLEVAALFHKVHRFPHLMQNPTGETCWPCFWILEVPFVMQLFGFTLLLPGGRRIAHPSLWMSQTNPCSSSCSILQESFRICFYFRYIPTRVTFLKILLWYGLSI